MSWWAFGGMQSMAIKSTCWRRFRTPPLPSDARLYICSMCRRTGWLPRPNVRGADGVEGKRPMAEKAPMTRQGYEALVIELKHLRAVIRPQVIEAVRLAREEGDLRENAEYHGAKEKQAIIEGKIRHLETQLANAEVIDTGTLGGDRVVFGATVQVREAETDAEREFRLVGADEA